jgi:hypothetical protein
MRLYDGEIYKTTNMENKFLSEKYKTPKELKEAQQKIEGELEQFDKDLWVLNDSINNLPANNKNAKQNKAKAPKMSKPKNASSAATYSARDRR